MASGAEPNYDPRADCPASPGELTCGSTGFPVGLLGRDKKHLTGFRSGCGTFRSLRGWGAREDPGSVRKGIFSARCRTVGRDSFRIRRHSGPIRFLTAVSLELGRAGFWDAELYSPASRRQPSGGSIGAIIGPCIEGNRCAWGSLMNSVDDGFE